MKDLAIKNSGCTALIGIVIFLPFTITGLYLVINEDKGNIYLDWFVFLLFASLTLLNVWILFDKRTRIVINENGIDDKKLGVGVIEWNDILDVKVVRAGKMDLIHLKLENPSKYKNKMSLFNKITAKLNHTLAGDSVQINVNIVDMEAVEIAEMIMTRVLEARQNTP